jgi:transposase
LGGPIVLVWDNLTAHYDAVMQKLITARTWLRVNRFPTYAPELNPVEGLWSNLKRGLGNLAARSIDQLTVLVKPDSRRCNTAPTSSTPSSPRPASSWLPIHLETLTYQPQ